MPVKLEAGSRGSSASRGLAGFQKIVDNVVRCVSPGDGFECAVGNAAGLDVWLGAQVASVHEVRASRRASFSVDGTADDESHTSRPRRREVVIPFPAGLYRLFGFIIAGAYCKT